MKTFFINPNYLIRKWYIIDANKKTLGRLSNEISQLLIGKYNCYDFSKKNEQNSIIVLNSKYILYKYCINKYYYKNNQKPGNLKKIQYKSLIAKFPEKLLNKAISNMISKRALIKHIYIYTKNTILYYKK
jgi:large subunit ribosomal protein L13